MSSALSSSSRPQPDRSRTQRRVQRSSALRPWQPQALSPAESLSAPISPARGLALRAPGTAQPVRLGSTSSQHSGSRPSGSPRSRSANLRSLMVQWMFTQPLGARPSTDRSPRSRTKTTAQAPAPKTPFTKAPAPKTPFTKASPSTPNRSTAFNSPLPEPPARRIRRLEVQNLNPNTRLPLWLRHLVLIQQSSSIALLLLGVMTFTVYTWTVQSQRLWGKTYEQLDQLRRKEPQLTAANEVMKDELAKQAETPSSGLISPEPGQGVVYLQPSLPRPIPPSPPKSPQAAPTSPVSY